MLLVFSKQLSSIVGIFKFKLNLDRTIYFLVFCQYFISILSVFYSILSVCSQYFLKYFFSILLVFSQYFISILSVSCQYFSSIFFIAYFQYFISILLVFCQYFFIYLYEMFGNIDYMYQTHCSYRWAASECLRSPCDHWPCAALRKHAPCVHRATH